MQNEFKYSDEKFADIQMLRYRLKDFESLTVRQKVYIYYLAKASLAGRDITFDQFGKYNLKIRKTLEAIYVDFKGSRTDIDFAAFEVYLKKVWFSNGIYHHYGNEKFEPGFSEAFFRSQVLAADKDKLPLDKGQTVDSLLDELAPVIFNKLLLSKKVNKRDGDDLVATSACNFYENVSQKEVEDYYDAQKEPADESPVSYGLNAKLVKTGSTISELRWTTEGMYGKALTAIVGYLQQARKYADNEKQQRLIDLLVEYYTTGDLKLFDQYSIEWLSEQEGMVDFINGFIEVYDDPLGLKGTWEGLVEYVDKEATRRTELISQNAQWFEDHSPVDSRFKKKQVKGVSAKVICAAMLGGGEYPASAIGINLPNAEWIRARYGSKSVTIGNLTEAYNHVARANGFNAEFVVDDEVRRMIEQYGDLCDDLHTDLHECLGHGSGQLLPGTDADALKAYGNTIEEARADLFGLYYVADHKLVELGLLPSDEAYKSAYYTYMMNGLMTQLVRIKPGHDIEEAHMRNRALIARWAYAHADGAVQLVVREEKTYLEINDYEALRRLFAALLAEIQRIKSEGDIGAARELVEKYAVKVDAQLHEEVLERYRQLSISPYKGFINPRLVPRMQGEEIVDIDVDYSESYENQMLRYSEEYGYLV